MMDIVWIRYQKDKERKHILLLLVDEDKDNYVGIASESFTSKDASLILSTIDELSKMTASGQLAWVKEMMPHAYRAGYRRINKKNAVIVRRWDIKKREKLPSA